MDRSPFVALLLLVLASGCVSTAPLAPGSPTPTAPPEVQTPTGDCTVGSLPDAEYPSLPDTLSESSVESFALSFERAYSSAAIESRRGDEFGGFDGSWTEETRAAGEGYLVQATASLDFTAASDGTTVAGSENSVAWYYVTERFAVRAPTEWGGIPENGWETVACG